MTVDKTEFSATSGYDPPVVGYTTTYNFTIRVENIGGATTYNDVVVQDIPTPTGATVGITWVDGETWTGTAPTTTITWDATSITWNIPAIASNQTGTLGFTLDVTPLQPGQITLERAIDLTAYAEGKPVDTGDEDIVVYAVEQGALEVDKAKIGVISGPDPPVVGSETVYELRITVKNTGGSPVTGVIVTDYISPDVTFVSLGTPSEGLASHSMGPPEVITWSSLDLGPDETEILTFQVSVTPMSTDTLDLDMATDLHALGTDTATSTTVEDDGDTTITVTPISITELPDVAAVSQIPSPTKVTQGEQVVITVTVSNPGSVSESFDVTCYYGDNIPIDTETVTVGPGGYTEVTFYWDTTGVSPGTYMITAWADSSRAIEEIDEGNNWCTYEADVEVVSPVVPPPPVGGEVYPVNKLAILASWIALGMAVVAGATIFMRRRRAPE